MRLLTLFALLFIACGARPYTKSSIPLPSAVAEGHIARTVQIFVDCGSLGRSTGSGVILDHNELTSRILTAEHVTEKGCTHEVEGIDGERIAAYIVHESPDHDIAMIRAFKAYPVAPIETAIPRIGDSVVVVGYPHDKHKGRTALTVSRGTLAANYGNEFRMTAQVRPGSSGGPVFDSMGRLIGVVTAYMVYPGTRLPFDGHYYGVPVSLIGIEL